ncbi:hypothetical protein MG293_014913 [Ovis ammon polii]|uniref:Uncharacterized protein n=1 Tax=Ovis ammon polii TaxID=230172 RepID=A0AAD4TU94_OVIAM|nr:hypothetical protein MG293_014913 [Ovis ammon polii]
MFRAFVVPHGYRTPERWGFFATAAVLKTELPKLPDSIQKPNKQTLSFLKELKSVNSNAPSSPRVLHVIKSTHGIQPGDHPLCLPLYISFFLDTLEDPKPVVLLESSDPSPWTVDALGIQEFL